MLVSERQQWTPKIIISVQGLLWTSAALSYNRDDPHHNPPTPTKRSSQLPHAMITSPLSGRHWASRWMFAFKSTCNPTTCLWPPRFSRCPQSFWVFAQLGLSSPHRQHQPNPAAVLLDSKPLHNEGLTLSTWEQASGIDERCIAFILFLSVYWKCPHKPWPKVKLFDGAQNWYFAVVSVFVCVCLFQKTL